jgi:hypothetical protein
MMGTVPGVTFKVEPWNPNAGAKSKLESAWSGFMASHRKRKLTREHAL